MHNWLQSVTPGYGYIYSIDIFKYLVKYIKTGAMTSQFYWYVNYEVCICTDYLYDDLSPPPPQLNNEDTEIYAAFDG